MNITGFTEGDLFDLNFDLNSLPPFEDATPQAPPLVANQPPLEDKVNTVADEIKQQLGILISAVPQDQFSKQRIPLTTRIVNVLSSQETDFWKKNGHTLAEVLTAFVNSVTPKEREEYCAASPLSQDQLTNFQQIVTYVHSLVLHTIHLLEESIKIDELFVRILSTQWKEKIQGVSQKDIASARTLCEKLVSIFCLEFPQPTAAASLRNVGNRVITAILSTMPDVEQIKLHPKMFIALFAAHVDASPAQDRALFAQTKIEPLTQSNKTIITSELTTKLKQNKNALDDAKRARHLTELYTFLLDIAAQYLNESQTKKNQKELITKLAQLDPTLLQSLSDSLKLDGGASLQKEVDAFITRNK